MEYKIKQVIDNAEVSIFYNPDNTTAEQIIEAVNNYAKVKKALSRLCDVAAKTTANIVAFDGAGQLDAAIDKARLAVNQKMKI